MTHVPFDSRQAKPFTYTGGADVYKRLSTFLDNV
jgi:hypothetical protein